MTVRRIARLTWRALAVAAALAVAVAAALAVAVASAPHLSSDAPGAATHGASDTPGAVTLGASDTPGGGRVESAEGPEGSVPIEVLAVRFLPGARLATVDLRDGEKAQYSPGPGGLAREPVDGAVLTDDGVVVWQADAALRVFSGDAAGPSLVHTPADLERSTPAGAAPSISALPTFDGQGLWVVQAGGCCADERPGQAELVDLGSGEVRVATALPPSSHPVAAFREGLVLNTLGYEETADGWVGREGSHEVLVLSEDGVVRELAAGEALAATGDQAAVIACGRHEPRADCELGLVDTATAERVEVPAPVDGTWGPVGEPGVPTNTPPWAAVSRHGRILLSVSGEPADADSPYVRRRHLVAVDTADQAGPTATVLYETDRKHLSAAWDAHGEHVVIAEAAEPHLTVVDVADGSSFIVRDAVPADHYLLGLR